MRSHREREEGRREVATSTSSSDIQHDFYAYETTGCLCREGTAKRHADRLNDKRLIQKKGARKETDRQTDKVTEIGGNVDEQ